MNNTITTANEKVSSNELCLALISNNHADSRCPLNSSLMNSHHSMIIVNELTSCQDLVRLNQTIHLDCILLDTHFLRTHCNIHIFEIIEYITHKPVILLLEDYEVSQVPLAIKAGIYSFVYKQQCSDEVLETAILQAMNHHHKQVDTQEIIGGLEKQILVTSQLSKCLAHDFRAPVNNLIGILEVISPENKAMEPIRQNGIISANMLKQKLDEAAQSIEKMCSGMANTEELVLSEICHEILANLKGDIVSTEASIEMNLKEAPTVVYSAFFFKSILENLIGNAIKYRSPGRKPQISIRAYREAEHFVLEVKDNGLGLDLQSQGAEMLGYRKRFQTAYQGQGKGLFNIKSQIESQGGFIVVKSKLNQGSCFAVHLKE